jgi:hypothetical protein
MPKRFQDLALVALCGAAGGALNAWHFLGLLWPVTEPLESGLVVIAWHLIPAGAAHGALLAGTALACAGLLRTRAPSTRLLAAPLVGWLAGYLAQIPVLWSLAQTFHWVAFLWPFSSARDLIGPLASFGSVALLYYLALLGRGPPLQFVIARIALCCAAGTLGSLYWWVGVSAQDTTWSSFWAGLRISALHGSIWGTLVGLGTWWTHRQRRLSRRPDSP